MSIHTLLVQKILKLKNRYFCLFVWSLFPRRLSSLASCAPIECIAKLSIASLAKSLFCFCFAQISWKEKIWFEKVRWEVFRLLKSHMDMYLKEVAKTTGKSCHFKIVCHCKRNMRWSLCLIDMQNVSEYVTKIFTRFQFKVLLTESYVHTEKGLSEERHLTAFSSNTDPVCIWFIFWLKFVYKVNTISVFWKGRLNIHLRSIWTLTSRNSRFCKCSWSRLKFP